MGGDGATVGTIGCIMYWMGRDEGNIESMHFLKDAYVPLKQQLVLLNSHKKIAVDKKLIFNLIVNTLLFYVLICNT